MRPWVFWPPAALLTAAVAASLVDFEGFLAGATAVNNFIIGRFGALFTYLPFAAVVILAGVAFSPLGAVRIGGPAATPILRRWNWFAITLCTTIATGILFWGTAEPIYHLNGPPTFAGAEAGGADAARFSLATLFFHWSITPYAIYTAPALAFALAYYNLRAPYSLSGPISLAFGERAARFAPAVDAAALIALVAGVAASLGAGILTLVGGAGAVFGVVDTTALRAAVAGLIVAVYVVSSASGLQRGIRILSDFNVRLFFALAAFVLFAGPTLAILRLGAESFVDFAAAFPFRSLYLGGAEDGGWVRSWTAFNFANWAAWAPVTALFLGRIARGYTVREFILFNGGFPALFGVFWMTIFGGGALVMDRANGGMLTAALEGEGPEAIIYGMFDLLPLAAIVAPVFVLTTFVSFVTAMDSNTHSIAGICIENEGEDEEEKERAGLRIKIFWGALIGAVALIMTSTKGVAGVKMLSNLGGAPGILLLGASLAALIRLVLMNQRAPISAVTRPASAE